MISQSHKDADDLSSDFTIDEQAKMINIWQKLQSSKNNNLTKSKNDSLNDQTTASESAPPSKQLSTTFAPVASLPVGINFDPLQNTRFSETHDANSARASSPSYSTSVPRFHPPIDLSPLTANQGPEGSQELKSRIQYLEGDNVKLVIQMRKLTDQLSRLTAQNKQIRDGHDVRASPPPRVRGNIGPSVGFQHQYANSPTVSPSRITPGNIESLRGEMQRLASLLQMEQQKNYNLGVQCQRLSHQITVMQSQANNQYPQLVSQINYLRHQLQVQRVEYNRKVGQLLESKTIVEREKDLLLRTHKLERQNKEKDRLIDDLREELESLQRSSISTSSHALRQIEEEIAHLKEQNGRLANRNPAEFDPERQRQVRNIKLVYETENGALKKELQQKQSRIRELLQELEQIKHGILGNSYEERQV